MILAFYYTFFKFIAWLRGNLSCYVQWVKLQFEIRCVCIKNNTFMSCLLEQNLLIDISIPILGSIIICVKDLHVYVFKIAKNSETIIFSNIAKLKLNLSCVWCLYIYVYIFPRSVYDYDDMIILLIKVTMKIN